MPKNRILPIFILMFALLSSGCQAPTPFPTMTSSPSLTADSPAVRGLPSAVSSPNPGVLPGSSVAGGPSSAVVFPPTSASLPTLQPTSPAEYPVQLIPLQGPVASPQAELSGLAWYEDTLILLPQYPNRFGSNGNGALFTFAKTDILAYLDGQASGPLQPQLVPLIAPGLEKKIPGFEGFESIAVQGNKVYLTIEASPQAMLSYLVAGTIAPGLSEIRLDTSRLAVIQPQANLPNMGDEALMAAGKRLLTFYEANGQGVNPQPVAHLFDLSLNLQGTVSIPHLEYRLTDVTPPDPAGRFWGINYFYPGETFLKASQDPLVEQFGQGETHRQNQEVERLVEFQFTEDGIILADQPPIQLQLVGDGQERNWEGLARLDHRGFLLVTDQYPGTLLGFVSSDE